MQGSGLVRSSGGPPLKKPGSKELSSAPAAAAVSSPNIPPASLPVPAGVAARTSAAAAASSASAPASPAAPSKPPASPVQKKGLPPSLQQLVGPNRAKSKKKLQRSASEAPSIDPEIVSSFVDQTMTLLKFRAAWEEAVNSGDQQKALAFTAKACKLLQLGLKIVQSDRKYVKKDLKWAAVLCQSRIRAKLAQRELKYHMYRCKVANEMVNTERSYMRALGIATTVYRKAAERCLSPADVNTIFSNMDSLRTLNMSFWRNLESRVRDWNVETCLGDIYLSSLKEVIGEYVKYVQGYDPALKLHEKLSQGGGKSKEYVRAMDECAQDEVTQGLTLGAYLILPVQRFPRYQLLLQDLVRHTKPSHPDHAQLEAALAEVVKMCNQINESTRNSSHFIALQKLERMLDSGYRLTEKPGRVLKAEAEVQEQIAGKWLGRTALVFDDMIVCVQKKNNKDEGWHVEWRVDGSNSHVGLLDPAASTFDLMEYRRIKTPPFTELVRHVLKPCDSSFPTAAWADAYRNFHTLLNVPTLLSDTYQWLTTNLVSARDWEVLRLAGGPKTYQKDAKICTVGQRVEQMYILDYGNVSIFAPMGKHVQVQIGEYSKDAFFGIECMLREPKFPFDAVCTASSAITAVSFRDLVSVLVADPHLCHRFWLLVCVVVAEKFHAWDMPKAIEKHLQRVFAGTTINMRDTLQDLLAPKSKQVEGPKRLADAGRGGANVRFSEEDERICTLFGLPPQAVVVSFDEVQFGTPGRGKAAFNRGTLYLFAQHLCFFSKIVGRTVKEVVPFSTITKLAPDEGDPSKMEIVSVVAGKADTWVMVVLAQGLAKRVFDAVQAAHAKASKKGAGGGADDASTQHADSKLNRRSTMVIGDRFRDPRLELTDQQWDLIFDKCSSTIKYRAGEFVVQEGAVITKIFQILSGVCRVETEIDVIQGTTVTKGVQVVGQMQAGDIFGEKTYLFGGATTAAVVAETDFVEVYVLERQALERLFGVFPELAGPFYKTLAEGIEARLFHRNDSVLRNYSALLVRKLHDGDISMDKLIGSGPAGAAVAAEAGSGAVPAATSAVPSGAKPLGANPAIVRVNRPVRKESLGQLKPYLPPPK